MMFKKFQANVKLAVETKVVGGKEEVLGPWLVFMVPNDPDRRYFELLWWQGMNNDDGNLAEWCVIGHMPDPSEEGLSDDQLVEEDSELYYVQRYVNARDALLEFVRIAAGEVPPYHTDTGPDA